MSNHGIRKGQIWLDPDNEIRFEVIAAGPQCVMVADIDREGGVIDLHPIVFRSLELVEDDQ